VVAAVAARTFSVEKDCVFLSHLSGEEFLAEGRAGRLRFAGGSNPKSAAQLGHNVQIE
jgi:hypothetical protein